TRSYRDGMGELPPPDPRLGDDSGIDPKGSADQRGHGIGVALDVYTKACLEKRAQAAEVLKNSIPTPERGRRSVKCPLMTARSAAACPLLYAGNIENAHLRLRRIMPRTGNLVGAGRESGNCFSKR